ncbi:26S protease regulatory subunit 4 [Heterocephalus glaber]|uniref:26S protease regulatory subunit 4 n=1 Tax=Heterocephalus glaber TaxID=10181 RepID=G5ANH0_HETGA|nr:26S protease regulatory subunit 4 [Heterocephalus glaber]
MSVGTLEEIIDDNHAIMSTSVGPEYYVSILPFVEKNLVEPGHSVLLNHEVHAMIEVLMDDTEPLVKVMKGGDKRVHHLKYNIEVTVDNLDELVTAELRSVHKDSYSSSSV